MNSFTFPSTLRGIALCLPLLALLPAAGAATLSVGNLVVTVNEFTGSTTAPKFIAEYTAGGARVQTLSNVPAANPSSPEQAKDLAVAAGGIYLYNGGASPRLSRFDLTSGSWTHQTLSGWSTIGNITYGGLARLGGSIFVTDNQTFGSVAQQAKGVIRFPLDGSPPVRFATTTDPTDLNAGLDGFLYTLEGSTVRRYDSVSANLIGSTTLTGVQDIRSIAVYSDGTIFAAGWGGEIGRFTATGTLLDKLTTTKSFSDIDINASGRIAAGVSHNSTEVLMTDANLDAFTTFQPGTSTVGGQVFVSWVPVPVPEPGAPLLAGLSLLAGLRRRRGCGLNPEVAV